MKRDESRLGTSGDAVLLVFIKLVTTALGFAVTRLLCQYLSVYDYGTYSQILLVISTVSSMTILGMIDGVNYFYCSKAEENRREAYISTIFALQCIVGAAAGCLVMLLTGPLCDYLGNPNIRGLLIFAAALPLLQNLISMLQVLVVSVGKARMLAVRNLIVSVLRLGAVILVISFVRNVAVILLTTLALDAAQITLFVWLLKKNGCAIRPSRIDLKLSKSIFHYCAPMAVFVAINILNRDVDKYLVTLVTDTQTLAVYANASRALPFDIIMSSFCTVLLPQITRLVVAGEHRRAAELYKVFLEIAYVTTGILCCAALSAAPQLMELLYSEKYLAGLPVFMIYILVDLVRFTNITLLMCAAGKTRLLMFLGMGAFAANAALNVVMYQWLGLPGPALATLLTTLASGILLLSLGARELGIKLPRFFDGKYLLLFAVESLVLTAVLYQLQKWLAAQGIPYFIVLVLICGGYCAVMGLLHGRRILGALKEVNRVTKTG